MSADVASYLILRATVAFIYLYAGWLNTRDSAARQWTVNHTAILFRRTAWAQSTRAHRVAATVGMAMMFGGGLSVLVGVEPRAGGLALTFFTAMGTLIHYRERNDARDYVKALGPDADPATIQVGWSAYAGHQSSWIKNIGLCGVGLFLFLADAGEGNPVVSDLLGAWFGWGGSS